MANILIMGDALLDQWVQGTVERMSPEDSSIPVLKQSSMVFQLGGAANVAVSLASAYEIVTLLTALKGDESVFCREFHAARPRGLEICPISYAWQTSSGLVCSTRTRGTTLARQTFRYDQDQPASVEDGEMLANTLTELFRRVASPSKLFAAVVVSDYAKGTMTEQMKAFAVAAQQHVPVFVSCKPEAVDSYRGVGTLVLNFTELLTAAENCVHPAMALANPCEAAEAAAQHVARKGFQTVIGTMGAAGAVVAEQGGATATIPATPLPIVTSCVGAGDTFFAAFIAHRLSGRPIQYAVHLANVMTAQAMTRPFTVHLEREDWTMLVLR